MNEINGIAFSQVFFMFFLKTKIWTLGVYLDEKKKDSSTSGKFTNVFDTATG